MTSGTFASVLIDYITVNRQDRQRRELTDIPALAASIAQVGLINPIVVRRKSLELVAGERRLEACRSLGWTNISVQWAEDLPNHELKAIELEENIKRSELPWQDQCRAVQEYHNLRASRDDEWNKLATAKALGYSDSAVSHILNVAAELTNGNPTIAKAETFSTARNIVQRTAERRAASVLAEIAAKPKENIPILTANFLDWKYDDPSFTFFNLIHCDFPYGINADNQDQGHNVAMHGGYKDTPEAYLALLERLSKMDFVAESAHLIFWFSMEHYQPTLNLLRAMGWQVSPFPLVWWKSDNTGLLPDPARGPRRVYETAFMGARGDRKIISAVSNLTAAPVTKEHHMSEKPVNVLTHFFRMLVDDSTRIFDPTCGSANALIAAKRLGASALLGLEVNEEFADRARVNWRSAFEP